MSKYELIIFDCDGTLVDTETLVNKVFSQVMIDMGYTEYTYDYCYNSYTGYSYKTIAEDIVKKHPGFPLKEFEEKFVEHAISVMGEQLKSIPNAEELLSSLDGIKKCIATNGEHPVVVYSLEVTGLIKYFDSDTVFSYELVENPKPAPDVYLYAANHFNVNPAKCLVIEDSIVGATASVAAGMDTIAYLSEYHKNQPGKIKQFEDLGVKAVIHDLMDVLKYINKK